VCPCCMLAAVVSTIIAAVNMIVSMREKAQCVWLAESKPVVTEVNLYFVCGAILLLAKQMLVEPL
jgi:hypothetical protein